ncbi:MAG: carbon-nitrogen family hydrolase [Anaerolineales bacterium]|nr:carbon-nitrogen family hydrolase [Anaerolineales bacterium]
MQFTVSLGQMDVKLGQPDANLKTVRTLTAEAAQRGADVVVFPELWSTGYDLERAGQYATGLDAGNFAAVAELARRYRIHILGSMLSLIEPGKYGNTAVWFGPEGGILGAYTKLHLFRLMDEHHYLMPGETPTIVETPWGKAGLAICYDLRFPELFRHYALAGAGLVFLPAEWPHPRRAHWRTLLRARAIENQSYVVACNRVGESKGVRFCGHSAVIDPWGETVVEGNEDEGLLTATIDTDLVAEVRAKIPVFEDWRPIE